MKEVIKAASFFVCLFAAAALITPPSVYYFFNYLDYWFGGYHAAAKSAPVADNTKGPCSMPSRD